MSNMEETCIVVNKRSEDHQLDLVDLPPGFRFHPTDEEIITHYLTEKVVNAGFTSSAIGDADLNKCEPWDLPSKLNKFNQPCLLLLRLLLLLLEIRVIVINIIIILI